MTTYSALITDLQQWAEDDSTEFQTSLPDIVALAEDRIFLDAPNILEFRASETGSLSSSTKTFTSAATDIRAVRYIYLTISGVNTFLEARKDDFIEDYASTSATGGVPKFYCLQNSGTTGTTFLVGPTPNSAYSYTLKYTRMPTRLSTINATTFIGNNYPSIIFKAAQFESSIFLHKEDTMKALLKSEYDSQIAKLVAEIDRSYLEEDAIGG
tara:strand:+ start:391 stop:1026 length:636 start_codon:yes stop_codon:yes gene_type:complete